MALGKCKECGKLISPKAESCPFCGSPPRRKLAQTKIGCFSSIIIIILIVVTFNYISDFSDRRAAEDAARKKAKIEAQKLTETAEEEARNKAQEAELRRKNISYFEKNQKKIISQLTDYFVKGEYVKVISGSEKYLPAEDPELKQLYSKAASILRAKERKEKEERILAQLIKIPVSESKRNLDLYRELEDIDPNNQFYKDKIAYYQRRYDRKKEKENCDLELLSWRWSTTGSGNYVTAEGEVKNISGRKLERVQALVTWYDRNDNLITSDTSTIEYSPLMPGQASPFKVMESYNPAMKKANLRFKFLFGDSIRVYSERR